MHSRKKGLTTIAVAVIALAHFGFGLAYPADGGHSQRANATPLHATQQDSVSRQGLGEPGTSAPLLPLGPSPLWVAEIDQEDAWFGYSVSGAGDVNGDGYQDVIAGARYYDNGETDEGGAFVYHGTASGLSSTPSWTAEGDQDSVYFGSSVAYAGDVNGDGYADVIVGAPDYANGESSEGAAFVYHGGPGGLSATPQWTAESNHAGAHLGYAVAGAGDINGDGYADVIVGAPDYANGESSEGAAFVYYGGESGLSSTPAWTVAGEQVNSHLGRSVASAGDVNGDGFSDVIVGAPDYSNGEDREGIALVYHGSASGLSASSSWSAESGQENARLGCSVSGAGDVNGDGYSDVVVGARLFDSGEPDEGRAFVFCGSESGLSATYAWKADSNQNSIEFASRVAAAGDVNGDGYSDVIVGAYKCTLDRPEIGMVFVYLGGADGLSSTVGWTVAGDQMRCWLAISVASAGDINGDGNPDIIVGACRYNNPEDDEGLVYVYDVIPFTPPPTPEWDAESDHYRAHFGNRVSQAGDVNDDGYDDVIVGALYYDNGEEDEGRALVYHGGPAGLLSEAAWAVEGNQANCGLGVCVACAGDVNGDGYSDVIVGAYLYDSGEDDEGAAFVYHGGPSGLSPIPATTLQSNQIGARFGYSVAGAGDVNGDGYSDVIVGATRYDNDQTDDGAAFVYLGSASGIAGTPVWMADSDQSECGFGVSVAGAGDVDADGYSDVIVGAHKYSDFDFEEGHAFLYHGSPSGPSVTPDWMDGAKNTWAQYGVSVASAGDVNGDGYSDVIVGASYYCFGGLGLDCGGQVYFYAGSDTGLPSSAVWKDGHSQEDAYFGHSVSSAGDMDGDGYSDIVVAGYRYDVWTWNDGRVDVYKGSPSGLPAEPDWRAWGDEPGTNFGVSVSGAGDVNGDGCADLIVGAPWYDHDEANEGRVFVYHGPNGTVDVPNDPRGRHPNALFQNYPNPFRRASGTTIPYSAEKTGRAEIRIFDAAGRLVNSISRLARSGDNSFAWDGTGMEGRPLAPGVYFYEVVLDGFRAHRKMILVR